MDQSPDKLFALIGRQTVVIQGLQERLVQQQGENLKLQSELAEAQKQLEQIKSE